MIRRQEHWLVKTVLLVPLLVAGSVDSVRALEFPGPAPGQAEGRVRGDSLTLENNLLAMTWSLRGGQLKPGRVTNKLSEVTLDLAGDECFQIVLANTPLPGSHTLKASDLKIVGRAELSDLRSESQSARLAEQLGGKQIVVRLASADSNLEAEWRAILRNGSNYLQQQVVFQVKEKATEVNEFVLLELAAPDAKVIGVVDGSPVVAGNWFFAYEHPMSKSQIVQSNPHVELANDRRDLKRFRCMLPYNTILTPGQPLVQSSVIGVSPTGQLRRSFLYYLERERAQPYRPFLHHNNGEDIGMTYWNLKSERPEQAEQFRATQQQIWIELIETLGRELVQRRGVVVDSFVHDWEWDDETLVWQFNSGFPNGFAPLQPVVEKYNSVVGIWLSPWGGYAGRADRVRSGRQQGFETTDRGLTLAGPRYYSRFRAACEGLLRRYGINYFKFDGFGIGHNQNGPGEQMSDVEALLRLIGELRKLQPTVFVNPSTGSWPSPYWLWYGDAIWRQGSDAGVSGKGSKRQQWITYRDSSTYHGTVTRGPLYPINSLMLHGIMINTGRRVATFETPDINDEIRSFFGTGTNLQELYIDPRFMTEETWDTLAEAAKWARANTDVLVDTHWVGGDPARNEVYGWASWSERKGILVLRNPGDQAVRFNLDIGRAFELPRGAAQKYSLKSPWREDAGRAAISVSAGNARAFELEPFEVRVWEAMPERQ